MKKLGKCIKKYGFIYEQEYANQYGYIYSQWSKKKDASKDELVSHIIFKKMVNKLRTFKGKTFEETERFPHAEQFGKWAWNYFAIERCFDKLNEIKEAHLRTQSRVVDLLPNNQSKTG